MGSLGIHVGVLSEPMLVEWGPKKLYTHLVDTLGTLWLHFRMHLCSDFREHSGSFIARVVWGKYTRRPHGCTILEVLASEKPFLLESFFISNLFYTDHIF